MKSPLGVRLRGRLEPPGDKSVGHRLALLAAIAEGSSRLERYAPGRDCGSTLDVLEALGVGVSREGDVVTIHGVGAAGLRKPATDLDAGNSGTTARLACGLLAPQRFDSTLVGDESLSRRPFARVIDPLTRMGARFESEAGRLPVRIRGGATLSGIDYELPVPSAQVKTALLLAGLFAEGRTVVRERLASRDHTEIALRGFGAPPSVENGSVAVRGGARLTGGSFRLPGDISSAAFFVGAAAFLEGSDLVVENVGLNPTRTAFLDVLRAMGADITAEPEPSVEGREPIGTLRVRGRALGGTAVEPEQVPALIDEIPLLAVVAAFAQGTTRFTGVSELRVKESDRLGAIVAGLSTLGADVRMLPDGFEVRGGRGLGAAELESFGDHRMVMAWAIASLGVDGTCKINCLDQVKISYPGFWRTLERLTS